MSTLTVAEERAALLVVNSKSRMALDSVNSNTNLYLATLCSLLAPLIMGYTLGYSSPAVPDLVDQGILSSGQTSWFGSMIAIGAIFGGPIAGFGVSFCGRKFTIMICSLPVVVGYATIAAVSSVSALYIGRILTGIGTGMMSLAIPLYIAELSSPSLRGTLGASFQLAVTVGILLVNVLGIVLSYVWLAIVGCFICALLVCAMLFMPETPQYCIMVRQRDQALTTLLWLRGREFDVERECRRIEDDVNSHSDKFQYKEFLQVNLYLPLAISIMLMVFQQFSGINAIIFYAVSIFQKASPSIEDHVAAIIITGVQVVATVVAVLLMDRAGRRILLIIAGIGMCISCSTFGLYYQLTDTNNSNSSSNTSLFGALSNDAQTSESPSADLTWLSLTSMIVYITSFSLGWGAIPWLIMSEIFPVRARGAASAIATATNWICAFVVTKEFFDMSDAMTDAGVFWFFGGVCLLGVIFVILCVPETKGISLEEITDYFSRDNKVLDFPEPVEQLDSSEDLMKP